MGSKKRKDSSELRGFGRVVTGTVNDCSRANLERLLQDYDKQLYLRWNTDKKGGQGCWELRRRPDAPTKIFHGEVDGKKLYSLEYKELDIVAHVLDLDHLSYDLLGKLKSMDTWNSKNWVDEMDYKAAKYKEREDAANRAELRYNIQQHKREWRELASLARSGANLGQVLKGLRVK